MKNEVLLEEEGRPTASPTPRRGGGVACGFAMAVAECAQEGSRSGEAGRRRAASANAFKDGTPQELSPHAAPGPACPNPHPPWENPPTWRQRVRGAAALAAGTSQLRKRTMEACGHHFSVQTFDLGSLGPDLNRIPPTQEDEALSTYHYEGLNLPNSNTRDLRIFLGLLSLLG